MHPVKLGIFLNTVSMILLGIGALNSQSLSVGAGFLNDLADTLGLTILLIGRRNAKRKISWYPFGLERGAYVASLIALMIFSGTVVGYVVNKIMYTNLEDFHVSSNYLSITSTLLAMMLNLTVFGYVLIFYTRMGRDHDPSIRSMIVDTSADSLTGVVSFLAVYTRDRFVDIAGSIIIVGIIITLSIATGLRFYEVLVGRSPPKKVLKKVLDAILNINGVVDVNLFKAVMLTEDTYLLILQVEAAEHIGVKEAEALSDNIERIVKSVEPRFKYVYIEVVPRKAEPPTFKQIIREIDGMSE
ncbi:cation transporter [Thermogladius sp. 4427co]|uniref:cation transporter n=1 Tax=Thermogladius sp. 4427co TaxID=3450718 RepID=UPI003F7AB892